ncbi:MAG: aliphatic sulfonate ABC transporter substrate-binding protein [Synergistaceae bacterium]|jgi:sulfonate transport system substrate-binding protein|nr:aliphatic sulfonate ABC transporter substrate-binding protein [Synergistaceae bacterium]
MKFIKTAKVFLNVFSILLLAGLLFAGTAFGAQAASLNQAKVIHVGWQGSSQIRHLAVAEGFFEKEFGADGIKVEFEQFAYGPPIIEGLAAGSLDFGEVGDMPIVTAVANGLPIQSIYKTGVNPDSNTLLIPVNSTITSVAELKGKKVAASIGSSGHHYLVLVLATVGLTVEDVELVNLGATDLGAALASGQIDAGTTWEPYGTIFTGNGSAKYLAKSAGVKQNTSTIIVRKEFAEKNPDITVRYLKVALQIDDFLQQDRERAIRLIAQESGFKESDLSGFLINQYNPYFTDFDWDQITKTKDFLLKSGLIDQDFDVRTLYTDKYLIEAEKLYKASKK